MRHRPPPKMFDPRRETMRVRDFVLAGVGIVAAAAFFTYFVVAPVFPAVFGDLAR